MNDETRTVAWAILVFAAGFLLVYVLFFGVHGSELRAGSPTYTGSTAVVQPASTLPSTNTNNANRPNTANTRPLTMQQSGTQQERAAYQQMDAEIYEAYYWSPSDSRSPVPAQVPAWPQVLDGKTFYSAQDLFAEDGNSNADIAWQPSPNTSASTAVTLAPGQVMLSNTFVRQSKKWPFKPLEFLGIRSDAQYILKDINNTHYIYMWAFTTDLSSTVRSLWGNLVEIRDQTTIRNDILFWEKVQLISLPQMPTKQLLLVSFNQWKDVRFLQIDKDYFVTNKRYIQEQFDFAYNR